LKYTYTEMSSRSRFLMISTFTAFGVCCLGLLAGLCQGVYAIVHQHRSLEDILGHDIPFYKSLGAIGILGFLFFLAFLISAAADPKQDESHR